MPYRYNDITEKCIASNIFVRRVEIDELNILQCKKLEKENEKLMKEKQQRGLGKTKAGLF